MFGEILFVVVFDYVFDEFVVKGVDGVGVLEGGYGVL